MIAQGREDKCLAPAPNNLFYPPDEGDYIYFETPRYRPDEPTLVSAARAADASMFAYARYVARRMTEQDFRDRLARAGYQSVATIGDCFADNARTARGFFAANDDHGLLAFRGTEKDNANDKITDADVLMVDEGGARVHRGFQQYMDTVWWRVKELVGEYRTGHQDKPIFITGHSLGAALACLAFTRLSDPATNLFTFGCPRVGDRAFCQLIENAPQAKKCLRIVDNLDIVTHVPIATAEFRYEHPGIALLWLDDKHAPIQNPPKPPTDSSDTIHLALGFAEGHWFEDLSRPLADHSPVRYCQWIGMAARS